MSGRFIKTLLSDQYCPLDLLLRIPMVMTRNLWYTVTDDRERLAWFSRDNHGTLA